MKPFFLFLMMFFTINAFSQKDNGKIDIRFGSGTYLLGVFDSYADMGWMVENEINYRIDSLFTVGAALNLSQSYSQWNLVLFVSPFKKKRLRIGGGLTGINFTNDPYLDVFGSAIAFVVPQGAFGYSFILEHTIPLRKRWLLGFKVYGQVFFGGFFNSGALVKTGMRF